MTDYQSAAAWCSGVVLLGLALDLLGRLRAG